MNDNFEIATVNTQPHEGQKPGTSGLRKKVKVFEQKHYVENFIQATLDVLFASLTDNEDPKNVSLVVGGDGRYLSKPVINKIISLCAANQVKSLFIGKDGILSTPAASLLIRKFKTNGGILLTASHNPGGPENDFGIKFNTKNGGPAPESVTDKIYEQTKAITQYKTTKKETDYNISQSGDFQVGNMKVQVIDSVSHYVDLLKSIFDFELIKEFVNKKENNFSVLFDAMHGVTGPYAKQIFVGEFGLPESSVMNSIPKENFGGGHPDPNLTYAKDLVDKVRKENISFGAASDGDGDRNMIISSDEFVNPSDSIAVIAANYFRINYFKKKGLTGVARSMPTSQALDKVANKLKIKCFETPTGWKFFGNLMDHNEIQLCGEESFGTGSDHIREKDGIWAVIAWLNIIAHTQKTHNETQITIKHILAEHYKMFGRNYFSRYDFEDIDSTKAKNMIDYLNSNMSSLKGKSFNNNEFVVKQVDNFEYTDPIDKSISKNQGLRIIFECGSRIIFRLSGTGSSGATIRIYFEKYQHDYNKITQNYDADKALKSLINVALVDIAKIEEFIGTSVPTVIT